MKSYAAQKQFALFLVTGSLAALVNVGSRMLYSVWFKFAAAVVLAYITGMVTAFILAKRFVFQGSQQKTSRSLAFFILVNAAAVLQTWLISMGLAYYLLPALGLKHFVYEIAHGAGVMVPVFSSYVGHKRWSFR